MGWRQECRRSLWLLLGFPGSLMADSLFLEGTSGDPGTAVNAGVRLLNERRIVGMQFDLKIPGGQAVASGALAMEGMEHHRLSTRVLSDRLRVVVHSTTNAEVPSGEFLSIPLSLSSTSPQGGPAFTVENLIFTNAAGQTVSGAVFYHPLEVWRQERFTQEQRENADIIGDFKDPDGDGFTNIMEFLFSTDPMRKDESALASQSIGQQSLPDASGNFIPGPVVFSFDYPQAKGVDGVNLWVESSTDLKTWVREAVEPVNAGSRDNLTDQMRLVVQSDPTTAPKRFFRMGAARAADAVPQPGFVPKVPYSEWIARSFSGGDLGNAALAGEQADPDGDGMVNLMEYLFGSDPRSPSTAPLPGAGVVVDGGLKTAVLKYGASREADGVFLLVEASTNLQTWMPVKYTDAPTGRAVATAVEIASTIEGPAPDKQFFRFRAARSLSSTVPFSSWKPRFFSGADLTDASVTGAQADPDDDGLVNLMEYYLGSNPRSFSPGVMPLPGIRGSGASRIAFLTYDVAKETEGVELKIQGSEDLQHWTQKTFQEVPTGITTETKIRISAEIDGAAPDRQFFRFEIKEK
jgi:hypothetical protein